MRVPRLMSEFFEWRWAPCAALTVGSLAFVGLAVLIIPTQLDDGGGGPASSFRTTGRASPTPNNMFGASMTQATTATLFAAREPERRVLPSPPPAQFIDAPRQFSDPPRRGFSPPIERPVPAPVPLPPAPQPPPSPQATPAPAPPPPLNEAAPVPAPDPASGPIAPGVVAPDQPPPAAPTPP